MALRIELHLEPSALVIWAIPMLGELKLTVLRRRAITAALHAALPILHQTAPLVRPIRFLTDPH